MDNDISVKRSYRMDELPKKRMVVAAKLKQLSSAEKLVYSALVDQNVKSDDLSQIAKICKLTELQVLSLFNFCCIRRCYPRKNYYLENKGAAAATPLFFNFELIHLAR
jgi:hypothetical protein